MTSLAGMMYVGVAVALLGMAFFALPGMLGADDLITKNATAPTDATQAAVDLAAGYDDVGTVWSLAVIALFASMCIVGFFMFYRVV